MKHRYKNRNRRKVAKYELNVEKRLERLVFEAIFRIQENFSKLLRCFDINMTSV